MNNFLAALSLIFSKSLNDMALPILLVRLFSDFSFWEFYEFLSVSRLKMSGVENLLSRLCVLVDELCFLVTTPDSQLVC